MVKVKGKTKAPLQHSAEVTASDSKPSDSHSPSLPEVEESSAPVSTAKADSFLGTEAISEPANKKARLQQQLAHVETQVRYCACLDAHTFRSKTQQQEHTCIADS